MSGAFLAALAAIALTTGWATSQQYDPTSDWGIESGFVITVDSVGFNLPTAIAMVPQPGDGPEDPIYYVTELGGKVKVVTNDRSVHTFAEDFFELKPKADLPSTGGEVGLAGICLDPRRGYVFVTFAYDDSNRVLRNNVVRFESKPGTFSIEPAGQVAFTEVFSADESSPSHQIGPCQVDGDFLIVSVGDGEKPAFSQINDSTLGKILRMTLDGGPVSDNPFYQDAATKNPSNYVWAKGFRNPFGLKTLDGRVFVADNGQNLDRFLEAQAGVNYLWDGFNSSIGANASMVLSPSTGVVQMDRYPSGLTLFPEQYRQSFFLTRSGNLPWTPQSEARRPPNILTIEYSLESKTILAVPKEFLRYQGRQNQMLVGLGFGPSGLYLVPLNPDENGVSAIYRVSYQPGQARSLTQSALGIMGQKGCFACHSLDGTGGSLGPPLDQKGLITRVTTRLGSFEYLQTIDAINLLDREPFISFKDARNQVLNANGQEQVRAWLEYRIQEPRFDNVVAVMPDLEVTPQEAALIADFLLTPPESEGFIDRWIERGGKLFPRPRKRHLAYYFGAGVFLGGVAFGFLYAAVRVLQRRQKAKAVTSGSSR
jgi:glucose/arabinose dehydrogenase